MTWTIVCPAAMSNFLSRAWVFIASCLAFVISQGCIYLRGLTIFAFDGSANCEDNEPSCEGNKQIFTFKPWIMKLGSDVKYQIKR